MNVNNKIYSTTSKALKLNESAINNDRYILEGIFAELDVMNVNHRIYTESEYLKHLQYIREDIKKGDLLGELDHPEDRFETKLSNASHRIIDIWYEPRTKMVMGKIELLTTSKGMEARELVNCGVPLHISSRAAGTINKDNTVSIQQIYTYDLVAKPGFAKATLHRVNESADSNSYSQNVLDFLKESEKMENKNTINTTLLEEGFYTDGKLIPCSLRKEAEAIMENKDMKVDMTKLTRHINEEANVAQEDNSAASAAAAGIPSADMELNTANEEDKEKEKTKDVSEVDKTEDKKKDSDSEDKEKEDDYEIIDVKAFEDDDDDSKKEEDDSEESDKEHDEDDKKEDDDTAKNEEESLEDKNEKKATDANKLFDRKEALKKRNDKFSEQFEELVNRIKTKNKVTESVANELHTLYPFTKYMSESSIVEFSELSDNKKRKVRDYLNESLVINTNDVDYVWRNGLVENFNSEPIWLQKASQEYRDLYYEATPEKRYELTECAKYLNFYTQSDIDSFWRNSDLKTQKERQLMYETYVNSIPKIVKKSDEELMPYSMDSVMKMVETCC